MSTLERLFGLQHAFAHPVTAGIVVVVVVACSIVAYDWREQHVPTFEEEILQYKKNGITYFAFWSWHEDMARLIKKHGIRPHIWLTMPSPKAGTDDEKVETAAKKLLPLVKRVGELGCKVGPYNHAVVSRAALCHPPRCRPSGSAS